MYYLIEKNEQNIVTGWTLDRNNQTPDNKTFCEREPIVGLDKIIYGQFTPASAQEIEIFNENRKPKTDIEAIYKSRRVRYLEAYRNYQAAVNYGEFERVPAIDIFIAQLRNKNWAVLNNVPPQIKYFTGEISLAQSGLIAKFN